MPGRLTLCATPIGNLGDVSERLREVLAAADVVYAEDTRRSGALLSAIGVRAQLRSYFAGNEAERARELLQRLRDGAEVALITDAGMPGISDPGLSAVRAARAAGAEITIVPGASAVTAALAVSGLPSERFVFEGFLPRRGGARVARLVAVAHEERTVVLFSSPHRVAEDLGDLVDTLGPDRVVCVARELTKLHEEVRTGSIGEAAERWRDEPNPRGEFTLVIAGREQAEPDLGGAVSAVEDAVAAGERRSEAVRRVAQEWGVSRNALYELVLERGDPD